MSAIKNILFDLGGIFMNLDYYKTENAFLQLGVARFPEMFTQHHVNPLFADFETGKISPAGFYEAFRKEAGISLSDEQIRDAWNAMLLNFPPERISWLQEIAKRYRIFLFSNTNQVHYDAFIEQFRKDTGLPELNSLFEKAYYSHELGLRKPHPDAFRYILKEQGLVAAETLFIDDTSKNIEGAKEAGLQTIHLVAPQTVLDLDL
jgi:putative hydrolase of the HAD superfamily